RLAAPDAVPGAGDDGDLAVEQPHGTSTLPVLRCQTFSDRYVNLTGEVQPGMAVDTSVIGKSTGKWRVVIERGPVANFAASVKDTSPVYQSPEAAKAAGFDAIPVPVTFPFVMAHWGAFPEQQPPDGKLDGPSPVMKVIGTLMQSGGLVLHGE